MCFSLLLPPHCVFLVCLLSFLSLGPAGALKPIFLSIQMLRPHPPTSAPRASQERSKTVPRVSQRTRLQTQTFELVQNCRTSPKDFDTFVFSLFLPPHCVFPVCLLSFLSLGPAGTLNPPISVDPNAPPPSALRRPGSVPRVS